MKIERIFMGESEIEETNYKTLREFIDKELNVEEEIHVTENCAILKMLGGAIVEYSVV